MLKVLVTPLNLAVSAAVVIGLSKLLSVDTGVTVEGNTVTLDHVVMSESTKAMVKELDSLEKSGKKKILLHVRSPGGSVLDGREVNEEIRSSKAQVNTLVSNFAMSMGMDFLLTGKERFATPEAIGMIHRGSAGGMSYFALKIKLIEIQTKLDSLVQGKSAATKPRMSVSPTGSFSIVDESDTAGSLLTELESLESAVDAMDKLFEPTFKKLEELKKTAPSPEKVEALIESLKLGNRDVFLSATDMLELGIVTKIVSSTEEAKKLTDANS